ncbi:deoxynucleoside kinase [Pseudothermotoga thermarum]|uniref:Deoxynucleoside kinase n=1 Tax=Pseudothermotoga thermarum DSM 5069 TaxID=688269 RepID=F7YWQ8_9THEM|nr:deoxynucleoside kinase [Pseudothermotoga thermarum]AEH52048.1 deoxynucleoside kinase [Pseudothermotoga thermarum DSM 5069]
MLEIVVEGTVGAGKTALVEILEKEMGMIGFYEMGDPIADRILERYYTDKRRWCLTMELFFLHKRFLQINQANSVEKAVMDRSMMGDFVFVKMQKELGLLDELEYEIYESFYRTFNKIVQPSKLLVYIKCSVDTAVKRIQKRGRHYEINVEKSYWEKLKFFYDQTFNETDHSNTLIIDGDTIDYVENPTHKLLVLSAIERCLKNPGKHLLSTDGLRELELV